MKDEMNVFSEESVSMAIWDVNVYDFQVDNLEELVDFFIARNIVSFIPIMCCLRTTSPITSGKLLVKWYSNLMRTVNTHTNKNPLFSVLCSFIATQTRQHSITSRIIFLSLQTTIPQRNFFFGREPLVFWSWSWL